MKNHRYHTSMPIVLAAAVASVLPGVADAQLEEVLVTAERREASVQDVPIAVSAYSEEMIERLQIDDSLDLIHPVPAQVSTLNGLAERGAAKVCACKVSE